MEKRSCHKLLGSPSFVDIKAHKKFLQQFIRSKTFQAQNAHPGSPHRDPVSLDVGIGIPMDGRKVLYDAESTFAPREYLRQGMGAEMRTSLAPEPWSHK